MKEKPWIARLGSGTCERHGIRTVREQRREVAFPPPRPSRRFLFCSVGLTGDADQPDGALVALPCDGVRLRRSLVCFDGACFSPLVRRLVVFLVVASLGCGNRVKRGPDFANNAKVSPGTIELQGWVSGVRVHSSTCTYSVAGEELRFDIETVEEPGCAGGSAASGTVAVVECKGPTLAPGHYRVVDQTHDASSASLVLEGEVDARGFGSFGLRP